MIGNMMMLNLLIRFTIKGNKCFLEEVHIDSMVILG